MLDIAMKQRFIQMRGEGKSYRAIAKELQISTATAQALNHELWNEIAQYKADALADLYNTYHITKTERIKSLGQTLNKIDSALEEVDIDTLAQVAPEKLIDMKLKYIGALKDEYIAPRETIAKAPNGGYDTHNLIVALGEVVDAVRSGNMTEKQADMETKAIMNALKGIEMTVLNDKLNRIDSVLSAR